MPDPREWSPRRKIRRLEELASDLIGDEKDPNLFFVTVEGAVVMITVDFKAAYEYWKFLSRANVETSLEDRKNGVIASVEPESDRPGARLVRYDDSHDFGYYT